MGGPVADRFQPLLRGAGATNSNGTEHDYPEASYPDDQARSDRPLGDASPHLTLMPEELNVTVTMTLPWFTLVFVGYDKDGGAMWFLLGKPQDPFWENQWPWRAK